MIYLPIPVQRLLDRLTAAGYEAYVVGGCVRDSLLGRTSKDWDVTTSARPEEMQRVFADCRVIETGLRHGTLTVLAAENWPVEVTTYRVDGGYSDGRHPDEVHFTRSLREDLARRDFTMNALAYRPGCGIVDPFGGQNDLFRRVIRCVGDPDERFTEDALRILRALRFASQLGFALDAATAASLRRQRQGLAAIAAERLAVELNGLLCGERVTEVLMAYPEVMAQVMPALDPMRNFAQNNPHHAYDVYEHTARSVAYVPAQPVLRLAMLLHDSGKPACYTQDARGIGHFYGHPAVSASLAREALTALKYDHATLERVVLLVTWHDVTLEPRVPVLRRWLNRLGEEALQQLLCLKEADIRAQAPELIGRLADIERLRQMVGQILAEKQCFSLRDLRINGHDLAALGLYPGKLMGDTLDALLNAVIDGDCPNDKAALLKRARILCGCAEDN